MKIASRSRSQAWESPFNMEYYTYLDFVGPDIVRVVKTGRKQWI